MVSSPKGTFIPKDLANTEAMRSFSSLSPGYFKVANELRLSAHDGKTPIFSYVFPSIVFFLAAFQAFLQEHLTLSHAMHEGLTDPRANDLLVKLESLKVQRQPYNDFKFWITEVFRIYDRNAVGLDSSSQEFQNLIALKDLRNAVIHYNPWLIEHTHWPARLRHALQQTKVEVWNASWVTNFSRPEVADWARETVKTAIQSFCEVSGAENPFTTTVFDGVHQWK